MFHGYAHYRAEAAKFRSMATDSDAETARSLLMLAKEYDAEASRLEYAPEPPVRPPMRKPE